MSEIIRFEKVSQYNAIKGVETLHPLVSVIDNSGKIPIPNGKYLFEFYVVFFKDIVCGELSYGRNKYDYEEGTLVFIGPGQVVGVQHDSNYRTPKGQVLLFHPDLLNGTHLGRNMKEYSFFSYELTEALHLSKKERASLDELLEKIDFEISQNIDKHSKTLIVNNIELFLNYCSRFYDRQFITRENINKGLVEKLEQLLDDYFNSKMPLELGLPSVAYLADKLNLSANYFGDLVKKETGKSAQEYIHLKLMRLAKNRVMGTTKSVSEIAYELGFKYPQHFTRMFKKSEGISPSEFRNLN